MQEFATNLMPWVLFHIFIFAMLALDLGIFHRRVHAVHAREALTWTMVWIALAACFGIGVYLIMGDNAALEFYTGFLVEKSLSIDNIFVILMIFTYLKVPSQYQHKILFWGILGALVMRAIFIVAGIALISRFHAIIYIFGGFLVFSGIRMLLPKKHEITVEKNRTLKVLRRFMRITETHDSGHFFKRLHGKLAATPLFVALVMVEVTDIIFAVDSIPAILAISTDPFIVYTSNVFAILGLRSLFFAVSELVESVYLLSYGLAAILIFVGTKMLIADVFKIPTLVALAVVAGLILVSVIASFLWPKRK